MQRMTRSSTFYRRVSLWLFGVGALMVPLSAFADLIQGPNLPRPNMEARKAQIVQARTFVRTEQVSPELMNLDLSSREGRHKLAVTPQVERAMLYVQKAHEAGINVKHAFREIQGKISANAQSSGGLTRSQKLFVEVTPRSFDLFRKIMGPNMLWPSGASNANHLYTMITDQGGGEGFYCNTYGHYNSPASASNAVGKVAAGLLLTDTQMGRLIDMLNASTQSGQPATVFGYKYKDRDGTEKSANIACTNWQTSAPIGDRPANLSRQKLQRLRQENEQNWPNRPAGLEGRESLASIFGLSRAQQPGIWMGKLIMAPTVPVIAVFGSRVGKKLERMTWNLGAVGQLQANGTVAGGAQVATTP